MITPGTHQTDTADKLIWVYFFAIIVIAGLVAGRQAIAWLLFKLYEFFIQKNPLL